MSQGDGNRLAALGDEASISGTSIIHEDLLTSCLHLNSKFICKKTQKLVALGHYMPS